MCARVHAAMATALAGAWLLGVLGAVPLGPLAAIPAGAQEPAPEHSDTPEETRIDRIHSQANQLLDEANFEAALPKCQAALELFRARDGNDALTTAEAHARLAWCYDGLGRREPARAHETEAARICALHADDPDRRRATVLQELGYLRYDLRDWPGAIRYWTAALQYFESLPQPDYEMVTWLQSDLALMYSIEGAYDREESMQVAAVRVAREHLPPTFRTATLLNNLGFIYWVQGRLDETERLYREALEISEGDPDAPAYRLATAHLNLGVVMREQSKFVASEEYLNQALKLSRDAYSDNDHERAYFPLEMGKTYAATDRWEDALGQWEDALQILAQLDPPHRIYEAQVRYDAGRALLARGDARAAERRFRETVELREAALGENHPEVGVALAGLAESLDAQGRSQDAQTQLARAISLLQDSPLEPETTAQAYALSARLARSRGDVDEARDDLERALTMVEELRPRRGGGDWTRAAFLQQYVDYYNEMIAWLIQDEAIEDALIYADRVRARVLRDQLAAGRVDLRSDIPAAQLEPLAQRERQARVRIARTQREIRQLRSKWTPPDPDGLQAIKDMETQLASELRQLSDVSEEIRLLSPTWAQLLHQQQAFELDDLRRVVLDDGDRLLLYQVGPQASYLFEVGPQGEALRCHELTVDERAARVLGMAPGPLNAEALATVLAGETGGSVVALAGMMEQVRGVAGVAPLGEAPPSDSTPSDLGEQLHATFNVLMPADVWSRVRDADQVILVPDGALHLLPFEMLVVAPPAGEATAATLTYWLDAGPVVRYAHGLSTMYEMEQARRGGSIREPTTRTVLTVSDPVFDPSEATQLAAAELVSDDTQRGSLALRRLPGTAEESAAILRSFPAGQVVSLSGTDATESRVKELAPRAEYLHLATHGLVEQGQSELLAALAFTPPTEANAASSDALEDGMLHLFEVYELNLACELAVLSACETSVGRHVQGEGVFALSRGFLSAGSARTVASLWAVSDASTATLIGNFFERIAAAPNDDIQFATLLRDAKRDVRNDPRWSAPYFWAPFVISGVR